jgi:LysR family transcriptional activator of nhaA
MNERALRLNLKHLRYFTEVARRGSVVAAAGALHVAPQTVSAQLRELQDSIGHPLFERVGRRLVLNGDGEVARDYAVALFSLADELGAVLGGKAQARRSVLRIGVPDGIPKLQTAAVVEPVVTRHRERVEGALSEMLGRLVAHELDAVLSELPVPPDLARSLQGRLLMKSGTSFLCTAALARKLGKNFPACLEGAPFLAGATRSTYGSQVVDTWLAQRQLHVTVVGRFDDSALLKCFAQRGLGVISAPTSIEGDLLKQYGLVLLGRAIEATQSLFIIRPRRQRIHPLVLEIEQAAQHA